MSTFGKAMAIAADAHQDQRDKGGHAYILHPMRLVMRLRTDDEELMCIAAMHDTVEDSKGSVTLETLKDEGFSERVVSALALLTHDPKVPYDTYIQAIASNTDAILVKLEDLRDNSDITRLKGLTDKDTDRIKKYQKAFTFLKRVLETKKLVGY